MAREDHERPPPLTVRRIIGQPLVSRTAERLGQVRDVVVRLTEKDDPPVMGLVVRIARRVVFVPTAEMTLLSTHANDERVRAEPFDAVELELAPLWG